MKNRFGEAVLQHKPLRRTACVDGSCIASVFCVAIIRQYSRVSGLFAWRLPLALMSSASKVPIGFTTSGGRDIRRSVLAFG
jgi:hypothetical protein